MFVTAFDGIFVAVVVISALLAMLRGFSRELLSLLSWCIAAVVAYFLFKYTFPIVSPYLSNKTIALIASFAIIFIVVFVIISIITMKLADLIIDSRIGAVDRGIGLVFGIFRGIFIMVIATLLINQLVKIEDQPPMIAQARSKPMLDHFSEMLWDKLPKDPEWLFNKASSVMKQNDKSIEVPAIEPPLNNTIDQDIENQNSND